MSEHDRESTPQDESSEQEEHRFRGDPGGWDDDESIGFQPKGDLDGGPPDIEDYGGTDTSAERRLPEVDIPGPGPSVLRRA